MIFKFVIVCSLLASPALAAGGVKGYSESGVKGGQRAIAAERYEEPTKTIERAEQQREEIITQQQQQQQQQLSSDEQRREELHTTATSQQKEEHYTAKGAHYEAKPQVRLDETKGGSTRLVETQQREETKSIKASEETRLAEQQRLEQQKIELQKLEQQRIDQQRLEQQKLEQQRWEQQQQRLDQLQQQREEQQAVELSREAQYSEQRAEEHQEQLYVQQQHEETKGGIIKGGQQQAAVAEAEPYAFDYSVEGSTRRESGDTRGVVRGQYTLRGADGSSRVVDYVADQNGFRATVNTNEFGTESRSPAGVEIRSSQPAAEDISLRLEGKTREFYEPPAVKGAAPLEPPKRPDNWSVKQAPINVNAPPVPPPAAIVAAAPVVPPVVVAAPAAPLVIVDEASSRAVRGKTNEEIRAPAQAVKGQRLEVLDQQQELLQQEPIREAAPIKSELRAPKAIAGELKRASAIPEEQIGQLRAVSGFESATAHRSAIQHSSPVHAVRQQQQQDYRRTIQRQQAVRSPVLRPLVQAAPVAPVHQRGHYQSVQPARGPIRREPSPRLSFYGGSSAETLDDSAANFEHPLE